MNRKIILLSVMMLTLGSPIYSSAASWELYDDFSSGTLDRQKWNYSSSTVSTITVENQRVKIVHQKGYPNENRWLQLMQDVETIVGVKASITISSCTGDVRTRVGGYGGSVGVNNIYSIFELQPGQEKIYSVSGLEGPPPDYPWLHELHYGQFQSPLNLLGKTYTVSTIFAYDGITYEADGLGEITYKYTSSSLAVDPTTYFWKAIGTRSTNGDGPCTVYVDNVYVLRP